MARIAAPVQPLDQRHVDEWFDSTSSRVWSTCCHLAVGDRRQTETLFVETYVASPRPGRAGESPADAASLVLIAHRLFLANEPVLGGRDDSHSEALQVLTRDQLVALHASVVIGCSPTTVAALVGSTEHAVLAQIAAATAALARVHIGDPINDAFRRTELWLDDEARDRVRGALRASLGDPDARDDTTSRR